MHAGAAVGAPPRDARVPRADDGAWWSPIAISWIGNFLYIFKLGPWPGLNYLTMSLGLSGAVLAWAVVSEGLLDLLPRAREALHRDDCRRRDHLSIAPIA